MDNWSYDIMIYPSEYDGALPNIHRRDVAIQVS